MIYGSKNKDRFKIQSAVIVSYKRPRVLYKDRQQLTEFVERMSYIGGKRPLPVKLVEITPEKRIVNAWETDTDEWLPDAFMPSALGAEEKVAQHSRSLLDI
jgi:hypothetical protein